MSTQQQIERRKRALARREADIHYWRQEALLWSNRAIDAKNEDVREERLKLRDSANAAVRLAERECEILRTKLGIASVQS